MRQAAKPNLVIYAPCFEGFEAVSGYLLHILSLSP